MNDSIARTDTLAQSGGWRDAAGWICAVLSAILFFVAGIWKLSDSPSAAVRMTQALVPANLSLAAAILFGIAETTAGILLLIPRFRRWGAWLTGLMLVAFLGYFAINYTALQGAECSCFPWVKRAVGPGFFIGDIVMLALAFGAGYWAKPLANWRGVAAITAVVSVLAFASYGLAVSRQSGALAPPTITADGKPFSTQEGKIFIYFFDPECMHCFDAAKTMSTLNWGDTKIVVVATAQPQFVEGFLRDTGLKGAVSPDLEILRKALPFPGTPAAVALENGRQKALLTQFEGDEPVATLKKLGFIQ